MFTKRAGASVVTAPARPPSSCRLTAAHLPRQNQNYSVRYTFLPSFSVPSILNICRGKEVLEAKIMKYIVAAFIAFGVLFGAAAQAAPAFPALMQTEQAVTTGSAVEKVCWGGGCGGWGAWGGGGGCGCCWRPCYRPCGYYGWGCGYRWWPYRPWYGGGWGWGGGGWGW